MTSFYEELNKRDVMSDDAEDRQSREKADKWIFGILLSVIGFMPLIVMGSIEEVISPVVSNIDFLLSGVKGEIFTSYKALFILVATVIAGLIFLTKIYFMNGEIRKTPINYFLGIFAISIVLATIFSPNISIASSGQYNRSDGAISWLCYLALMFMAMNINYPKKAISYVMYTLMPFVFINLFIIVMNFYGKDLLQYSTMQKTISLFLPEGAMLGSDSQLLGTLNQWNYMSGMFAIMAGMYLIWAVVDKFWLNSILGLVTSVASLSIMLMSLSRSGFVTVSLLMLIVLFVAIKSGKKMRNILLIVALLIMTAPIFHVLAEKNPRVWTETLGFIFDENPYVEKKAATSPTSYNLQLDLMNKAYAADNSFELPILPESAMSAGTGRTYIWGKALEVLKERPLLGYGLDTFTYNFPHYNIDARGGLRTEHTIVDKPHSLYVGVLYGTGIIGMIGFLGVIIMTVLPALKALITKTATHTFVLIIAWFGFLIQALFNDSLPGISAPMWLIAGMMVAFLAKDDSLKDN